MNEEKRIQKLQANPLPKVKRIERGWAAHYILSHRCLFRRNTLLIFKEVKVIVSTIGACIDIHASGYPNKITYMEIANGRWYETVVFKTKSVEGGYEDADISQMIDFKSPWKISKLDITTDNRANDMHEQVVEEIVERLKIGEIE